MASTARSNLPTSAYTGGFWRNAIPNHISRSIWMAPAEVLFARKGEKTLEELERRRQAFLQLRYRAKNFVQIDATRPSMSFMPKSAGL